MDSGGGGGVGLGRLRAVVLRLECLLGVARLDLGVARLDLGVARLDLGVEGGCALEQVGVAVVGLGG